ncbi:MAG: hypothetical protein K2O24_00875 [Muribaculaceae bacterium]|nr:hypothetical protein [Muribaculaceae bacterium]
MSVKITAQNFTLADFQEAARTYREELIHLTIIGLEEILPYVTVRPGVTYSETVGQASLGNVELAPYKKKRRAEAALDIVMRELKTYFGALNADFEPNQMISTILGHRASQAMGEALKSTPTAKEILALLVKAVARKLNLALWNAVRDAEGDTTADLFDGWDTITAREIKKGNIASAKGNYMKLTTEVDSTNAVSVMKKVMRALSTELRGEDCFIYCSQDLLDDYNEAYLLTHSGVAYNTKYNQVSVEGSNNRLTFVPLVSKTGSRFIHISTKENMLIGVDQLSDKERVDVGQYDPDVLTASMRMFFGVEFESIDPRRLMVVELASGEETAPVVPGSDDVEGPEAGDQQENV